MSEGDGTRFNVMRFQTGKNVNPATDFSRPVKLARRDLHQVVQNDSAVVPDALAATAGAAATAAAAAATPKPEYSVAPHGGQPMQRKQFRKKTHEVFQQDEAVRQLRQEERFPWVMEDSAGRETFQGALEGGQGGTYVFLKLTADGFDVTPVSKFYRFGQRQKYQTMSLDEAEQKMKQHKSLPRWVMKEGETSTRSDNYSEYEPQRQYRMKTTSSNQRVNVKAEEQEEELDFNEDFADDEEQHALVDDEEDNKELEERIKKEMLSANAIGEADPEAENEADQAAKAKLDKEGRRVQRFLEKLEKNNMYESDSDSNPYESSSSESDDDKDDKDAKTSATTSTKGDDDEKKKSQEKSRDDKIRESVNKLQNQSHTTYNTPNSSSIISRTPSSTSLTNAAAHARAARTRSHLVTLKVPKAILSKFPEIPGSAVPEKKRRAGGTDGYDSDRSQKKIRFQGSGVESPQISRATSPVGHIAASPLGSRSGSPDPDGDLITAAELRSIVQNAEADGGMNMKGLLRLLKPKLARDPRNKQALGGLMKESGLIVVDGKLSIRQ